ncbi:MAG: leucine-rich repeat protein [Lachnospiraceae bacterium]|nr:leucine-rich repeat protein [Lachnospiraceae bacterium]
MPFIYEKIIIGDTEGVEVLGYEGSAKHLSVPEELEGLPVLSLGKHAFTDKNTDLEEVSLPRGLLQIRSFAFYFCGSLKRITLYDGVTDYHDGAIRTNFNLHEIRIIMREDRYTLARRILGDSDRKILMMFSYPDRELRLVFPDYSSNSIEDTRAQAFHIRIDGTGFSYRECVCADGLRLREYDSLYRRTFSSDDPEISLEIAVARLMSPQSLSEDAAAAYRAQITSDMDKVLKLAMKPRNEGWMELLMNGKLLRKEDMDLALRLASEYKKIELTGQLMDYREQHFPKEAVGKLRLDDFDIF